MKSYTDLEQSKMLSGILPIENADMHYATWTILDDEFIVSPNQGSTIKSLQEDYGNQIIPCWSLAALLEVLPTIDNGNRNPVICKDIRLNKWHIVYHGTAVEPMIDSGVCDNLIDVVVEMILKLHEQKLI